MLPIAAASSLMNAGSASTASMTGGGTILGSAGAAMPLLGLGLFGLQAAGMFGKKKKAKIYIPTLSQEGRTTEANLQSTAKHQFYGDLMPMNLTSLVVGQSKRSEGKRRRTEEVGATGIARTSGSGYEGLTSGSDIGMIGSEGTNRMIGGISGEESLVNLRQNEFRNSLNTLSNLRSMEFKQAPSNLQIPLLKSQMSAINRSTRGRELGQLATMASMLAF